jgi:aryl-alcohol dehydrogenase-like predicted oxidoreductase
VEQIQLGDSRITSSRIGLGTWAIGGWVWGGKIRWVLDQGPTIALWGPRHPGQLDPIAEIGGWTIDAETKAAIDRILERTIINPASPAFMAPPVTRPAGIDVALAELATAN